MAPAGLILKYWSDARVDLEFYENQCFMCGCIQPLERAHIIPDCQGGTGEADNLHLLCKTCHTSTEYLTGQPYWDVFNYKYHHDYHMGLPFVIAKYKAAVNYGKKNNISDPLEAFGTMIGLTREGMSECNNNIKARSGCPGVFDVR